MAKKLASVPEAQAVPTNLENSDLSYLSYVISQVNQAQSVLNNFSGFLSQKYQLSEKDRIELDGRIIREADDTVDEV